MKNSNLLFPLHFCSHMHAKYTVRQNETGHLILKVRQMLLLNGTINSGEFGCFFPRTISTKRARWAPTSWAPTSYNWGYN